MGCKLCSSRNLQSTAVPACRTVNRYLPWLFNPPGNTATQGPREFLDCVAHIRLLSWMLLGAVNHTLKFGYSDSVACMPIPLEASCHIADHVQVCSIYSASLCKMHLFKPTLILYLSTNFSLTLGPTLFR